MTKENTDTQDFSLSFSAFGDIFNKTIKAFLPIFWRMFVVNLIMTLLILIALFIVGIVSFLVAGNDQESLLELVKLSTNYVPEAANQINTEAIELGTNNLLSNIPFLITSITLFIAYVIFAITCSLLSYIANTLVIKNYVNKDNKNPLTVYLIDSREYFWRYLRLNLRIFWYIFWPMLTIVLIPLSFYRAFRTYFANFLLIHFNTSPKKAFQKSLEIATGNFWGIVSFAILLGLIIFGISIVIGIPLGVLNMMIAVATNHNTIIYQIVSQLSSLLINTITIPITMAFYYLFTLYMVKAKKISI